MTTDANKLRYWGGLDLERELVSGGFCWERQNRPVKLPPRNQRSLIKIPPKEKPRVLTPEQAARKKAQQAAAKAATRARWRELGIIK